MQVFGLELRKANNIQNLYKDVDVILKDFDVNKMRIGAVAHSLQKMLQSERYFDICVIDKCIKLTQIPVSKERYDIYSSQHCINWNEMSSEFRQVLIAMVLDDFRSVLLLENKI